MAIVFCLRPPGSALAFRAPDPQDNVLPDFDIREQMVPAQVQPLASAVQAVEVQRARVPGGVHVRYGRLTGTVRWLVATGGFLTPPSPQAPDQIGLEFIGAYRDLFGLTDASVAALVKYRQYRNPGDAVTHVEYDQVVQGIQVFEAAMRFQVSASGQLLGISSSAAPVPEHANTAPTITAGEAVLKASESIGENLTSPPAMKSPPQGSDQAAVYDHGPFATDISVRLVFFPWNDDLRLAWRVYLKPTGFPRGYLVLIDAATGNVLYRQNMYFYAEGVGKVVYSDKTWRGIPRPDEHPLGSGGCPPISNLVEGVSLTDGFRDKDTVLFDTQLTKNRLRGNNARVFRGALGVEGAEAFRHPSGCGPPPAEACEYWLFEEFSNFNDPGQAEVQLFFAANFLHDFFYKLGFTEAAGNYQQINVFGRVNRGGVGGDAVQVIARDPSIPNNAAWDPNFAALFADGSGPNTMLMGLFDSADCWAEDLDGNSATKELDSAYDLDIIIHEYHHGVALRLIRSLNSESEWRAVHEGGGDFFAYSIHGNTTLGEYVRPPHGLRHLLDGTTYGDWTCDPTCKTHWYDNGQIWANVLWRLRERFKSEFHKEEWAIDEIHRLYIDGLKLSPLFPTMLDLRDSMLLADRMRNPRPGAPGGSWHYCIMYEVFADRGMGVYARDTDETATTPKTVTEDFTVPKMCRTLPPPPANVCDVDADGDIDRADIDLIFAARNTPASPGDPRDADGDGWITVNDARICAVQCTIPGCAP